MEISDLSLEKFGSIGGDYFEMLIAVALDELGYVEGKTYIPSWYKKCVPGTWIEADFIITDKRAKHKDPLNNPKYVFAVGHATSENSAQMKFHRDVEQLLEVKALPNGDDMLVVDILFCCPRETMGGWSSDLIAINEAIFDNHLIVWKYDWGLGLLKCLQDDSDHLSTGNNETVKRRNINKLLKKRKDFRKHFHQLKNHVQKILSDRKSHSKIQDMFVHERVALAERLKMPLMVTSKEKTEYKRGLIQVLALNDWELNLLYENHHVWLNGGTKPLETLALENGMSQEDFEKWWERLNMLSVKIGNCERKLNEYDDDILSEDTREYGFFGASKQLGYVFEKFDLDALLIFHGDLSDTSSNLMAYADELRDLSRQQKFFGFICDSIDRNDFKSFHKCMAAHFLDGKALGLPVSRLTLMEIGMAIVHHYNEKFSYDQLCKKSDSKYLKANSNTFRRFPKLQGNPENRRFIAGEKVLWKELIIIGKKAMSLETSQIAQNYVKRSLDGMGKQPRAGQGAIDVITKSQLFTFAKKLGGKIHVAADQQGERSLLDSFADTSQAGVNVEVPYVLVLRDKRRIFIHRVMSDGGMGHKRKEFASKIRTIRYRKTEAGITPRDDYFCSILILDGNWITPKLDDQFMPIRMLTVAGWDYVVYPDGLSDAFAAIKKRLTAKDKPSAIHIPDEIELPLAAEPDKPIQLKGRKKAKKAKKRPQVRARNGS
jgi:hypothetical protein